MSEASPHVRFVNVSALGRAPGYSHVVEVRGGRTVFVSGQVALDAEGAVVGAGDFAAQARKVFENIGQALAEVGLTFHSVVKLTFFLTDFAHLAEMRTVRDEFVNVQAPPASSAVQVARLVHPELLLEVEAIAAAP